MDIRPGNAWWQGRRQEQQDAFGFAGFDDDILRTHGGVLMVLADGMGGMSGGREASRVAVEHFMAAYRQKPAQEDIPAALERALAAANRAVYELALTREGEGEVGTTLVAAVVHEGVVHWIGVGDSRLYLYQAAGDTLTLCTEDHTQGNELLEQVARGALTRAEAEADPDFHALVSFLGLRDIPKVDRSVRPLPLTAGDRLLLVSDGVYGTLAETDIGMLLRDEAQPAAEALIRAVRDRAGAGQDNATATVIAFGDALPPTRIAQARTPAPTRSGTARSGTAAHASAQRRRGLGKGLKRGLAALAVLLLGIGIGVYLTSPQKQPPPAVVDGGVEDGTMVPDPQRETFYTDPPDAADPAVQPPETELPATVDQPSPEKQAEQTQANAPQPEQSPAGPGLPPVYVPPAPLGPQPTPPPPAREPDPQVPATKAPKEPERTTPPVDGEGKSDGAPVVELRPQKQAEPPLTDDGPPDETAPDADAEEKGGFFRGIGRFLFGDGNGGDSKDSDATGKGDSGGSTDNPFLENH